MVVLFLLFIHLIQAQNSTEKHQKSPLSIYTFSGFLSDANGFFCINKKLNFGTYSFVFKNRLVVEKEHFSTLSDAENKKSTTFTYNAIQKYLDQKLVKDFIQKNDPSQWNLHCPQPNL